MITKLVKHGDGYALILGEAILELLHIDPEQPVEVSTDGTMLTIRPVTDPRRGSRFEESVAKANRQHGKALKKLAG